MSDNTILNIGSGGDTVRSVQKGGSSGPKTSVVTIDLGGSGAESLIAGTVPVSGTVALAAGTAVIGHTIVDTLPALPAGSNALGTVGVTALPALPAGTNVIGHVIVDTAPTTTVTGTVTANAGTGTFAVSAAILPLPTGAATAAKQPALGTAGTPSADVLSVQGITSGTPFHVVVDTAPTTTVTGTVTANAGSGPFPVGGTVASGATDSGNPVKIGGVYHASLPTLTDGQRGDIQVNANGVLEVAIVSGGGSGGTASSFGAAYPATGTAAGFKDSTGVNMAAGNLDASGNLLVNVAAGGGSGGTSSSFAAAFPATGTAIGAKNGANMVFVGADASNNLNVNVAAGTVGIAAGTAVIGHVIVDTAPTTTVTGTVALGAGTAVIGHVVVDTAPTTAITAASLPLPTGASTAARQPALGTAGTPSVDVLSVQGVASGTPLHVVVDTAPTTTVTGTIAATQSGSWTVTANAGTGTMAVSATSLPLPTGAATSAKQPALGTAGTPSADVLSVQGVTSGTPFHVVVDTAPTTTVTGTVTANAGSGPFPVGGTVASGATDSGNPVKVGGVYHTSLPTLTDGQRGDLQIDANGILKVAIASGGGSGGTASSFGAAFPATGTAAGFLDSTGVNMAAGNLDASGNLLVAIGAGGGSGGTASTVGAAVPSTATAVGFSDGTNMQLAHVFDADSGAGTEWVTGVSLRGSGSGGSVELATASNPLRTDPTGTTIQPVSGTVTLGAGTAVVGHVIVDTAPTTAITAAALPLPTGAATAAKQPALGTAGTASTDVITVQGIASGTALAVSGTVTAHAQDGAGNALTSTSAGSLRPLDVIVYDTTGTAIAPGTEYTEGDTAATPSGSAVFFQGATNLMHVVSATNPLPVTTTLGAGTAVIGHVIVDTAPTTAITAAALPLPTGASTAAKQPALGTAGTAASDVLSVQGIASMTPILVDGSGVMQPVSAASLPLPTGAATAAKQPALGTAGAASTDVITVQGIASGTALAVSGTVTANAGTGTMAVSAAALPLPTGASTSAKQPTLGTAGTPSADVITVQGVTSMTPLAVTLGAGTAAAGQMITAAQTNQLFTGTTALTPAFAAISASTNGDANTIVAATAGKVIRVLKWAIQVAGTAVNFTFKDFDGSTTYTALTGVFTGLANQPFSGAYCPIGHFVTQSGHALTLTLSAGNAVGGYIVYVKE